MFSFLRADDLVAFSRTCKAARSLCLENLVWKSLCFRTFEKPEILNIDVHDAPYIVDLFRSEVQDKEILKKFLTENHWRLVYAALCNLEKMPSVVYPIARHFTRCSTECLGTSRSFTVTSRKGEIEFKGVEQATCVEFIVYNYEMKA